MIFKVDWVENKSPDWKIATIIEAVEGGKEYRDVSINRTDHKTNAEFPGFDGLQPGSEVRGEIWRNPAGKWYLFPPRAPKSRSRKLLSRMNRL
jgi:hypothetical protein